MKLMTVLLDALGGHNATQKWYLKISTSYYWLKMIQDIKKHKNFCLCCQQRKKSTNKRTPLPILDQPNLRVHADLFGPMITADSNKKFVLCITDAFTKYAVVMAIASKDAEILADADAKQGIVFEIRHSSADSHGQWQGVRQQTVSGSSTMQCSSGGF